MNRTDAQYKTDLTIKEQRKVDIANNTKQLNELNIIKAAADTKAGMDFIKMILNYTNPLAKAYHKNGKEMAYNIGVQEVGRWLIEKLTGVGIDLKLTDFVGGLHGERITFLTNDIEKLLKEEREDE